MFIYITLSLLKFGIKLKALKVIFVKIDKIEKKKRISLDTHFSYYKSLKMKYVCWSLKKSGRIKLIGIRLVTEFNEFKLK